MRRLFILIFLFVCSLPVFGQTTSLSARRLSSGTAVPTRNCSPGPSYTDFYMRTTTDVLYFCAAAPNTWSVFATSGADGTVTSVTGTANQISVATGTTTPVISLPSAVTLTGSLTNPLLIGGTTTTSPLTLRATSGVGTTGADVVIQAGNSAEVARFFSTGFVSIGSAVDSGNTLYVGGNTSATNIIMERGGGAPSLDLRNTGGTITSRTIVGVDAGLGTLLVRGYDGAAFRQAAKIDFSVDGTPGASDMPGKIVFSTTLDGAASPTERMRINNAGAISINGTITAGGTTGAQTINKPSGTVNFAAAATSLVVTNSLVSTSSIIQCTVGTNDTTMKSAQCVAGSGSFTIFANAAANAETRVNFTVTGVN